MVEVVEEGELESVVVYECPDCGEYFTREEADPEGTNRSPCCGKMGSKHGEGLHVEEEVVIMQPEKRAAMKPAMKAKISTLVGSGYVRQALEKYDGFTRDEVDAMIALLQGA